MCRYPPDALVDNAPLREAFETSDLTAYELATRIGLTRRYARRRRDGTTTGETRIGGDATVALRDLGLKPGAGRARGRVRLKITSEKALRYAKALGVDPADLGL